MFSWLCSQGVLKSDLQIGFSFIPASKLVVVLLSSISTDSSTFLVMSSSCILTLAASHSTLFLLYCVCTAILFFSSRLLTAYRCSFSLISRFLLSHQYRHGAVRTGYLYTTPFFCSDILLSCSSCIETTKILCGQLDVWCTICRRFD